MPATTPQLRESSGCRNPRKKSSSIKGPSVTANNPNRTSHTGDFRNLSNGDGMVGGCKAAASADSKKGSANPANTASDRGTRGGSHPSDRNTGFPYRVEKLSRKPA